MLEGGEEATRLLRRWGVHERSLVGFALASRTSGVDVEHLLALWLDELGAEHVFAAQRGLIRGVVREGHAQEIAHRAQAFASTLYLGLGRPATTDALARSVDEARQACETARAGGERVVRYASIPTVSFVLGQLDADQTQRISRLLDPLRGVEQQPELIETLRVFLSTNSAWGESAMRLRIHRQTLAARIRRIEDLIGLSLSDPDDRVAARAACVGRLNPSERRRGPRRMARPSSETVDQRAAPASEPVVCPAGSKTMHWITRSLFRSHKSLVGTSVVTSNAESW